MKSLQDQLLSAIARENIFEISTLITSGALVNELDSQGWTPLAHAIEFENYQIVKLLLENGADVNSILYNGDTCLHYAVDIAIDGTIQTGGASGDEPTAIIELLLKNSANILAKNVQGESPMDWAKNYHSDKIVRLLQGKLEERSET